MIRRPPRSTRTDTLFPYTTLFRSSRGGFTSKIHARCDNQGLPVGFILTGGEASDYTAAEPLMAIPVATPKALLADKGYDGDRFRESLLVRSEEHTSELQSLMRNSYAVLCLKKKIFLHHKSIY